MRLRGRALAVLAALPLPIMACVVPPPLKLDSPDGGVNSPPAITSVRGEDGTELPYPGGLVAFDRGRGSLGVTLLDGDVADALSVRVFVDYTPSDPTPPRATCKAAAGETRERTAACDLGGLCLSADLGVERAMLIEVYDREVLDSGVPQFRAMPPSGLSTARQYRLRCQGPSS